MNAAFSSPVNIEKEMVRELRFPTGEVLHDQEQRHRRQAELDRALVLGNVDHNKVRIVFQDSEGTKEVQTTIWAVTDERIILKSGMVIPIRRILEVIT
jgi:uncharacterized protein (UPF0248 family)